MSAAETLVKIRKLIEQHEFFDIEEGVVTHHDSEYVVGTILEILDNNPVEYKYRVVNKFQKYKTYAVPTLVEAEMMLEEKGDSIQRKPVGEKWEDV